MAEVATLMIQILTEGGGKAESELLRLNAAAKVTENSIDGLTNAFKALGAAMVLREAGEAIKNSLLLAARYETLGATLGVMAANAGYTSQQMHQFQANLEQTGISAIKARMGLQIMAAAQLKLTESTRLGRVAQDAATLAGIDSSTAFNNLVRGITTGEVRIIRHMGIMANFTTALKNYADKHHVAVEALNAHQRAEARLENVLEEGAKRAGVYEAAMTTAGKQMLSMVRYTENLQVQIGEVFNPATNALVFALVDSLREAKTSMDAWQASGEKAVFAAQLKRDIMGLVSVVKTTGEVIYDTRVQLIALGIVFAASRVGPFTVGIWQLLVAFRAKLLVTKEALVANAALAESELAVAMTELNTARATSNSIETKMLKFKTDVALEALKKEEIASNIALIQSTNAVAGATAKATAANVALNTSMTGGSTILKMLGGPVGIAIAALGLLWLAWDRLKDKTEEASLAIWQATEDNLGKLKEDIQRQKVIAKLLKEGKTPEEARSTADFEAKKLRDTATEKKNLIVLTDALAKAEKDAANAFEDRVNRGLVYYKNDEEKLKAKNDYIATSTLKNWVMVESTKTKILETDMMNTEAYRRQTDNEATIAGKKSKNNELTDEAGARSKSLLSVLNLIAATEGKIADERARGLGLSKRGTEDEKAQDDYEEAVKKLNNQREEMARAKNKKDKGGLSGKEVASFDKAAELLLALRDEKLRTNDLIESKRLLIEQDTIVIGVYDKYANASENVGKKIHKLNQTVDEAARESDRTILLTRMEAKEVDELIASYDRQEDRLRNIIQAKKDLADDKAYAERLNRGRRDGDTTVQVELLNRAEATGELIVDVYTRAWIDIMMKGDTATAYIVQSTSKLFDALGTALGNFATGTKFSFKDLMSSLAKDLANFFAQKAVMQMFQLLVGVYLNSSSGGDLGNATGNANGSIIGAGKAYGGPVSAGMAYPVGEKGPELFYPGVSGQIVPNQGQGGGLVVNNYLTISGDKSSKSSSDNNSQGSAIGDSLFAMMNQWAVRERRPNGLLDMKATR